MPTVSTQSYRISGVASCVPEKVFDNQVDATSFSPKEVDAIVKMAGIRRRHLSASSTCSSDLCRQAAQRLMKRLDWSPESIDGLILVTQSPDYFQPSSSCVVHRDLKLSDNCAAFDVGLGCSGYSYGLWLASTMMQSPAFQRVLLLHGETPSRFTDPEDRSVGLLFGDAGTATAIEREGTGADSWWFSLQTDGTGLNDLIIPAGGFRDRFNADSRQHNLFMNGGGIMNFTLKRVPPLIQETLAAAGQGAEDVDYYIFHQSNRFIMRHLAKKCGIDETKIPFTLEEFGNTGGPSVPLTVTCGGMDRPSDRALSLMMVAYGVGLSWASALVDLPEDAILDHSIYADQTAEP